MIKGICIYNLVDMKPCTGKKCEKCELSPAYKDGYTNGVKDTNKRLNPLMKEITECVVAEAYDRGFDECQKKVAAGLWKTCKEELPKDGECVLAIVTGKGGRDIYFQNAILFAEYSIKEGWILQDYPMAKEIIIKYWADIHLPNE